MIVIAAVMLLAMLLLVVTIYDSPGTERVALMVLWIIVTKR